MSTDAVKCYSVDALGRTEPSVRGRGGIRIFFLTCVRFGASRDILQEPRRSVLLRIPDRRLVLVWGGVLRAICPLRIAQTRLRKVVRKGGETCTSLPEAEISLSVWTGRSVSAGRFVLQGHVNEGYKAVAVEALGEAGLDIVEDPLAGRVEDCVKPREVTKGEWLWRGRGVRDRMGVMRRGGRR